MLAEAQAAERSAKPATTSSEAIQHIASPHKANHPGARRRCKLAATPAKESLAMPLTPTAMFNDPLNFSVSQPHEGSSGGSLRHQAAPLPPVRACSFDIDLRAPISRGPSEALSTPELSPGPSRCSDGLSMECDHNQEACRGDDLFGSENEEDELESDMSASHGVEATMTTAMNDDDPEGAYRRVSGGGLESGLSPLAGFATLQLLH
ncbi:hypothetical protein DAEQUDRAFT_230942 [Daedalea quercina L-15889]|uniref:Uncharacterized protein n=1 Tax=Daedalea quercina L-15889 TaxID=1314783 RepID=A0A165QTI2_9APHY|nr:hypothetical protein DAEQUDRAFT_230942 [Daedalea quercina L-15889]